jgi:hypothetical protein
MNPRLPILVSVPIACTLAACQASVPIGANVKPLEWHGSLGSRYRGRVRDGANDHDWIQTVALDVGRADQRGWRATLSADARADLDGSEEDGSPFASLDDTRSGSVDARVYEAHAEYHGDDTLALARLGRQSESDLPLTLWHDGLHVESREFGSGRWSLGAFAGAPVRFYRDEAWSDFSGGLNVRARPWKGARVRLDWLHVEDDELLGDDGNELLALRWNQRVGERWRLESSASALDGEERDAGLLVGWNDDRRDLLVELRWRQLFRTQGQLALELDPFTSVLLEERPYTDARFLVSKGLGEHVHVDVGLDTRWLEDEDDEGLFNHGFERVYGTCALRGVLPEQFELALTAERWTSQSNDIDSWGVDLSRELAERLELSFGSFYALYKLDLLAGDERDDVRTWYARLRSSAASGLGWDARYEYEDDEGGAHTLRLGASWRF